MEILLLSFFTAGDFCIPVDTWMSFLTSSGIFLKKDTKSFVQYSAPEKYCEYGVHQVGLCLSHPSRGGGGRSGQRHRAKSSHAQHLEQRQTKELACVSAVYKWTGL